RRSGRRQQRQGRPDHRPHTGRERRGAGGGSFARQMSASGAIARPDATRPAQPAAQAALPPLKGPTLALTALALALGTFMQVLDSTIANVSLPTIAGNLGVSPGQGTWVITSFAVANGVGVPLTGWLMGRYGV